MARFFRGGKVPVLPYDWSVSLVGLIAQVAGIDHHWDSSSSSPSPTQVCLPVAENPNLRVIYWPAINKRVGTEAQPTCAPDSFPAFSYGSNRLPATCGGFLGQCYQTPTTKNRTSLAHPGSQGTSDIKAYFVLRGRFPKSRIPWLPHVTTMISRIRFAYYEAYSPCYAIMGIVGSVPTQGLTGTVVNTDIS